MIAAPHPVHWQFDRFLELSLLDLYALLQLRTEVFVMEQNCVFQDMDGADDQAMHLLGKRDGRLLAYARCFPAGVKFKEASIGRLVTHRSVRGQKLGHHAIDEAVHRLCKEWGVQPIRIGAQARLERFYMGHGFVTDGAVYVEDGIDHLQMLWKP
jgi:ElaA protein